MQSISGGLPNWNWYYLALLGNGLLGHWFLFLVGGWLFWALLAGEAVLKGVRLFHPLFFSRLAQPGDETFLFCGCFWVGLFCVLFGFVVLVLFLVSNCLIPFSSHKSCGVFQVSVEGHWTYSWTYVWVRRVSLRLFNLDCRYPRDLSQPARKKKECQKICQKECQKICQKICQKECQKICQKECQKICQKECRKICQKECQKICQKECQKICQKECQKICQKICQKECQKICQKECQKICQKECQKKCQKECQKICQKECQKICQKECQKICQKECQKICQKECQKICQKECQKICQKECQKICQEICQKECQKICHKECQKECQKKCQKECQKICQKECQKKCQKECQKICQKECQKICQKECQKIYQKECQKICQKENVRRYVRRYVKRYVRKNVRRYVRKNVKRYVRRMSEDMVGALWRSTDMFDACFFKYVWQVVSWHVLACLVYENASSGALQCVCDVWACAVAVTSFLLCFRKHAAMFDACFFKYVWQVVSWHVLACLVYENASSGALQCVCDVWACAVAVTSVLLCLRKHAAMFDACLFIYVWQVVSWHDLACLVYESASSGALQCVCDVWTCAVAVTSFLPCFRRYAAMFDACLFRYVWQVVSWHVLACLYWHVYAAVFDYCLFIYVWQVFSWHEYRARDDKRWTKKLLRVSMFWNVMVGITRSKLIFSNVRLGHAHRAFTSLHSLPHHALMRKPFWWWVKPSHYTQTLRLTDWLLFVCQYVCTVSDVSSGCCSVSLIILQIDQSVSFFLINQNTEL